MTAPDFVSPRELAALLPSASVEISSRGHQLQDLRDNFPQGIDVTITFLPGDNYRNNVATAAALRRAGFNPVPHIAAREIASREELDDFLARAHGEAGVTRILLIAGDVARVKGPFKSSFDVRASGLIEARGIASLSVAGHPEGHPYLETADAIKGLGAWRDWGRQTKIHVDVLTQFCFESAPILDWIGGLYAHGIDLPVIVGLAGPADAGHADEIRAPLRHRQFDAGAARPDRPFRPAVDRYRPPTTSCAACGRRRRPRRPRSPDSTCFHSGACANLATGLRDYVRETLPQMPRAVASVKDPQNP